MANLYKNIEETKAEKSSSSPSRKKKIERESNKPLVVKFLQKIVENADKNIEICPSLLEGDSLGLSMEALGMNANKYVIMCIKFIDEKVKILGLYWHNGDGRTGKLYGESTLPAQIRATMVDKFFKIDPIRKKVKCIQDAVCILPNLGKKVILSKHK